MYYSCKLQLLFTFLFPFEAFEQWKAEVEEKESCSFIKTTGMKGPVRYYQCNQGGVYKPKGTEKRHIKSQGTRNAVIKCEKLLLTLKPSICIKQACRKGQVQQGHLSPSPPQEWWKSAHFRKK